VILRSAQSETKENEVAVGDIVPVPGVPFEETLTAASPDLLREMVKGFAQRMMDAEVEQLCGAGYGEVSAGIWRATGPGWRRCAATPPPPRPPWPGWVTCGPAKTPRTRPRSRSPRRSPPPPAAALRHARAALGHAGALGVSHEFLRWAWPLAARAAHDLSDTATTNDLLALLDGYQPGELAPMQRAERDLARARLTTLDGGPAAAAAFTAAVTGLRQHSTPYHLAHGLLDHTAHLLHTGEDEAAAAATGEARGIAERLSCQPLLDRAETIEPARPRTAASS
jgi:hypothetical protein